MTQFSGDLECHEEYGVKDRKLLLRKWRQREKLGGVGRWQVEIGSEEDTAVGVAGKRSSGGGGGSGKSVVYSLFSSSRDKSYPTRCVLADFALTRCLLLCQHQGNR